MSFFSNKTINYLNLHIALVNLLDQAFIVFMPLYLYSCGFMVAQVMALVASFIFLRMPLRLLLLPFIARVGLRKGILFGGIGYALTFPVLSQAHGMDRWLALYMLLFAACNSMHWLCFHVYYSLAGDHEKRGRQVAVAQVLTAALSAFAPLLSAFIITENGFAHYFLLPVLLTAGMIFALSRCPDIALPRLHWRDGLKAASTFGMRVHLMDSAATYPMTLGWLFIVYFYMGKIMPLGGIITFGVLAQMAYQLVLGNWADKGHGKLIVHAGEGLRALVAILRAVLPVSLPMILGLETLNAASGVHHGASDPIALYNAGKQSSHTFYYWLMAEMGWDTGTVLGAGGGALLLWLGVPLKLVILLSVPFICVLWRLLFHYFAKHAYVKTA